MEYAAGGGSHDGDAADTHGGARRPGHARGGARRRSRQGRVRGGRSRRGRSRRGRAAVGGARPGAGAGASRPLRRPPGPPRGAGERGGRAVQRAGGAAGAAQPRPVADQPGGRPRRADVRAARRGVLRRRLGGGRAGSERSHRRSRRAHRRDRPGARRRRGGRPVPAHGAGDRGPQAPRRVPPHRQHREQDGRPAVLVRRRGDPGGPRGRHGGAARRPGRRARRRGNLAGAHRLGQHDGEQPHQPGALDLLRGHRHRRGRSVPQDHRVGAGRGRRAGRDDQLADRHAPAVRRRGDPGGPRGGHRGPAGRPGRGPRCCGYLEEPHRRGQPDGGQPHRAGARHRPGGHGGGPR
ncbi:MAG: hypothetical protein AVDCRST_MAG57-1242 [uncultured Blastococcus sp.]|uniref:Uncharacterized protein n=1 Tax=uncultured Blastococcus sp. TaxID=217144 RepID=A0A6J4HW20_9ACTN|nr:MAG: hypothetical protein AVDCRST_MAG57-1242 [uncultured Blastococcus sp.]